MGKLVGKAYVSKADRAKYKKENYKGNTNRMYAKEHIMRTGKAPAKGTKAPKGYRRAQHVGLGATGAAVVGLGATAALDHAGKHGHAWKAAGATAGALAVGYGALAAREHAAGKATNTKTAPLWGYNQRKPHVDHLNDGASSKADVRSSANRKNTKSMTKAHGRVGR